MGQIDLLFASYADLLERAEKKAPDLVEITAIASVLHSFYIKPKQLVLTSQAEIEVKL
jgi:hypothetical protein